MNHDVLFSEGFQKAYKAAEAECFNYRLGYIITEHVLYHCLLNTEISGQLLTLIEFSQLQNLKKKLAKYLDEYFTLLKVSDLEISWLNQNKPSELGFPTNGKPELLLFFSPMLSRIEAESVIILPNKQEKLICIESFLASIANQENSFSAQALTELGLTKDAIQKLFELPQVSEPNKKTEKDIIFKYCQNFYQQVINKKQTIIARENELNKVVEIFSRKDKNNVILSGSPGVGKTAILEKLVNQMSERKITANFNKAQVLLLDLGSLVAGTKFRGEFEERVDTLVKAFLANKKSTILIIENIHLVVGAGNSSGLDLAHFLTPLLQSSNLRIIGTTNQEMWRRIIEENKSFARFFEKVDVDPLSFEETLKVLEAKLPELEAHHRVSFDKSLLNLMVELSNKFLAKRHQPENALDLMDRVGAKVSVAVQQQKQPFNKIQISDIQETISEMAKIPKLKIASSEKNTILNLQNKLNKMVFGQQLAIEKLFQSIVVAKSGLRKNKKTIGSFLFIGSTGVGKTEVAKCLAEELNLPLLRFDMSEYMESHSISKLIGAPAGYVGYGKGGILSEAIEENPHAVVLIDELEKAHSEIYNLFLQIMDNGSFRDAQGRSINCQHMILIMTSNLGAGEFNKKHLGLATKTHQPTAKNILSKELRPEFLNRFDAIIPFNALSDKDFNLILEKYLTELNKQIASNGLILELNNDVKKYLIETSAAENMGARPLERIIEQTIKQPLALKLIEGIQNQKIKASFIQGVVELECESL